MEVQQNKFIAIKKIVRIVAGGDMFEFPFEEIDKAKEVFIKKMEYYSYASMRIIYELERHNG